MESPSSSIAAIVRAELLHQEGVIKFAPNRRFTTLYPEGSPADSVLFLDSGLVKICKRGKEAKEIILQIVSSGELCGEQALGLEHVRSSAAEVLQEGTIYVIPKDVFTRFCDGRADMWRHVAQLLVERKCALEKRVELLCMQDVENRILHYMAELAASFGSRLEGGHEYAIPLSQGELSSLIGATRETTSTTLNALARRGLIRLGRRQLILVSLDGVRGAARDRSAKAATKG
jgi:CRP/FNR family cyclic AMP-dependent transcriptional regulator